MVRVNPIEKNRKGLNAKTRVSGSFCNPPWILYFKMKGLSFPYEKHTDTGIRLKRGRGLRDKS